MHLQGSRTEANLKAAFTGEAQANRRYLYFASKADLEGHSEVATLFRAIADSEAGHASGHLDYLATVGDPVTGLPIGSSRDNLLAAITGETLAGTETYTDMAQTARAEGFDEIADWFELLARAERSHARRFQRALENLND